MGRLKLRYSAKNILLTKEGVENQTIAENRKLQMENTLETIFCYSPYE